MPNESLPTFKYHPHPLKTGSIKKSSKKCLCCGKARGYIYVGPIYASENLTDALCPWCIADGSAHKKFDAAFTDEEGIGGGGEWDEVSEKVIAEVAYRTPGFTGWQQEQWWTHCEDAAKFLGRAGKAELLAAGPEAVAAIRESIGLDEGEEWDEFLEALDKDGSPTAYLFQCTKCQKFGGYHDSD